MKKLLGILIVLMLFSGCARIEESYSARLMETIPIYNDCRLSPELIEALGYRDFDTCLQLKGIEFDIAAQNCAEKYTGHASLESERSFYYYDKCLYLWLEGEILEENLVSELFN